MKKLLIASLIIFGISCKKETPEPAPVTPATFQDNYCVIVGDGHTANDTFRFPHMRISGITGDSIDMATSDTTGYSVTSTFAGSTIFNDIPFHVGTTSLNWSADAGIAILGIGYAVNAINFTITSIGVSGGFVNGYYSGTMTSGNPSHPIVTVSGKFSVARN